MSDGIRLWAKLDRLPDGTVSRWHSLVDHSADVAAVAEALLSQPVFAARFAHLAGRSELDATTCSRLAALTFLHDIGKANRGFQKRVDPVAPMVGHIQPLAWLLKAPFAATLLERLLVALEYDAWCKWFSDGGWPLLDAIFAHHGRPWRLDVLQDDTRYWRPGPDLDPVGDLAVMGSAVRRWFPDAFEPGPTLPEAPAFHHAFAGLVMLADWLGSDPAFFPMACGKEADRMSDARHRAREALGRTGLEVETIRLRLNNTPPSFADAFAVPEPRPMQKAAAVPEACCVVLEAETGSGKTEAALWRFLHLFEAGTVDGLYFALPTRVAATQMFIRVRRLRDQVFGHDGPTVVLAVPGQQMVDTACGHVLPGFGFAWDDDPGDAARQARWAAEHPKRFLAAQIAVGTVDQALLGAIQVRHAHLRGTTLLRHLLVVDEVHASDRYMERLLAGLLREHTQAGGHALLLSATLGAGMRSRLLGTELPPPETAEAMAYPALSWAQDGRERTLPLAGSGSGKAVRMAMLGAIEAPELVAAEAVAAAIQRAKVLVIRNTVAAAVATAAAVEAALGERTDVLFKVAGIATVHHGRFGPEDRRLLDTAIDRLLGKQRPEGGLVVVGTQTLEVSLDLDADLLITDLCPVDVLLQRLGRLHRHERDRPLGFEAARAVVLTPRARDLLPLGRVGRNGLGGQVYDDLRVIEATLRLLEAYEIWRIPTMNRLLVERATHPVPLAAIRAELVARDEAWQGCLDKVEGTRQGQAQQAGYALLDRDVPFDKLVFDGDDHLATRLGAADRLILFDPPVPGPFGHAITMLRIPAHLLDVAASEMDPTDIAASSGTVTFGLGQRRFRYDRFGLRLA